MSLAQFDALPERDLRVAEWKREREIHKACGFPFAVCGNPESRFHPYRRVDYAQMEQAAAQAAYADLHENEPYHDGSFKHWAKDRSSSHPYHYSDGVSIDVAEADVAPWDEFTTRKVASPVPPTKKPDDAEAVSSGHQDGADSA